MMSGISNEKPALDLVRYIEYAWSLYESTGERIRKAGVRYPNSVVNHPILPIAPCGWWCGLLDPGFTGQMTSGRGRRDEQQLRRDGAISHLQAIPREASNTAMQNIEMGVRCADRGGPAKFRIQG
jgi:hypothetical protein